MDAPEDDRHGIRGRARGDRCANCGGELKVLVDIPPHVTPGGRDHPATRYFRCERCNHIRIIDK